MTNIDRVYEALVIEGKELSAKQMQAMFGIGNARAEVTRLRQAGYAIYANRHTDTKGRQVTKYRHGYPSRTLVAAGYKWLKLERDARADGVIL
jgi:hypothetical protein